MKSSLFQVPVCGHSFNGASGGMCVVRAASAEAAVSLVRAEGLHYDGEDRASLDDVVEVTDTGEPGIIAQYTWAE